MDESEQGRYYANIEGHKKGLPRYGVIKVAFE